MNTKVELGLIAFLEQFGLEDFLREGDLSVRLYHDCDVWGEEAEGCILNLRDKYGVDISNFQFDQYFPPELVKAPFSGIKIIYNSPFLRKYLTPRKEHKPLTFAEINLAIRTKKLPSQIYEE
ncbi:MAG: DUF1493 family protein [Gammaproteobacteria bacterium]